MRQTLTLPDRLQVETQFTFFLGKKIPYFLKANYLKAKLQIPSFCSTSSVCGAHGGLWSTEFTFSSVPFGDTGSRLTCTEESGVLEGVLPEDWNGDGMVTGTEAPRRGTEEEKVSKRGRRDPEGIESAAI